MKHLLSVARLGPRWDTTGMIPASLLLFAISVRAESMARGALGPITTTCRSEFHGVFADLKQDGLDPFASDLWLEFCRDYAGCIGLRSGSDPFANTLRRRLKHMILPHRWPSVAKSFAAGRVPDFETPDYMVPLIDAIRSTIKAKGSCSVIDVGGGWGDNFLLIGRALGAEISRLSYSVVDNARVTQLGTDLYAGCRQAPKFMNAVPDAKQSFDYVVVCGTLPYVDDWKSFLRLCKNIGQSIFLARTAITPAEGFYTRQTVFVNDTSAGSSPYRVLGCAELTAEMRDLQLIFQHKTEDYSSRFAGLPGKIEASYFSHLWRHH